MQRTDLKATPSLEIAEAVVTVLGDTTWEVAALCHGFLALHGGLTLEEAARIAYEHGAGTLRQSRNALEQAQRGNLIDVFPPRTNVGSAANPVTKLFPAAVTEQRFVELADRLCPLRKRLKCRDDRAAGHLLSDFTFIEDAVELPVNVKNAGTRFEKAGQLVHLDPNDCVPIPAYKAHAALDRLPSLVYVVSVDYSLIAVLDSLLPSTFDQHETLTWAVLNTFLGARVRNAEDAFVFGIVRRHWERIRAAIQHPPFSVVSARKAIRILQTKPNRTPGIGLRAWGTGASAEVNVHLSVSHDMKPWVEVSDRIRDRGLQDIITAVNRRRQEWVYDPEI